LQAASSQRSQLKLERRKEHTLSPEILLQSLVSGILIGLIYALVAVGLTLIFGVMDIVNFAHGEFVMFGMYSGFWLFALYALDPIYTLPLTMILLFALGALVYRLVIRRIIEAPMLSQIFTTFGLMILFRGIAQFLWKPDFRTVGKSVVDGTLSLAGIQIGTPQLVAGVGAVSMTAAIYLFLAKTKTGAALEATAADRESATLMGIDSQKMFLLAWGIGAACAGLAGALLATFFPIFPDVGANFILIAFVVVCLGGFGSVTGALCAGVLVGVIEVMGGVLVGPQFKIAIVLLLFLIVLMFRPQGLMGKGI
jgi:branched-chain amino acid transport system permease protein